MKSILLLPLILLIRWTRVAVWALLPVGPWVVLASVGSVLAPQSSDAIGIVSVFGVLISVWVLMFPPRPRGRPPTLRYRVAHSWLRVLPKPLTHRR